MLVFQVLNQLEKQNSPNWVPSPGSSTRSDGVCVNDLVPATVTLLNRPAHPNIDIPRRLNAIELLLPCRQQRVIKQFRVKVCEEAGGVRHTTVSSC